MDTRIVKYPQISEADLVGKLVSELDDRPQMLPSELKSRFDALGKEVIIPAVNTISTNIQKDFAEMNETIETTLGYTCKNLLKNTATSQEVNGVTFTVNEDGSITANGTATDIIRNPQIADITLVAGEKYILSGGVDDNRKIVFYYYADHTQLDVESKGGEVEFTAPVTGVYRAYVWTKSGETYNNLTFYPMLRRAEITDDTYEPYREPVSERLKSCLLIVSFDASTGKLVTKSADYEG